MFTTHPVTVKMNPLLFVISLFTAGGLGWFLHGTDKPIPESTGRSLTRETNAPPRLDRSTPSRRVLSEIAMFADDPSRTIVDYRDWDFADLKGLIDGLLEKSDPLDGLCHPFRGVLNQVILEMAKRDLEATLDWVDRKFPAQRLEFYRSIIERVMGDRPPLERLAFFEAHGFERKEISTFAATLMFSQNLRPMDTDTAIALQSKNVPRDDGLLGGGSNCQFAPDFDYSEFARTTLAQIKANDGRLPSSFPLNFMKSWAQESPQEAIDFYFDHCVGENAVKIAWQGVSDLLAGVKLGMSTDDYATWLGQTMSQQSKAGDKNLVDTLFFSELSNPELLRSALAHIDDPDLRFRLVNSTVLSSISYSYNPDGMVNLRNSLALIDDPTERLRQSDTAVLDLNKRWKNERIGWENAQLVQIDSQHEQIIANLRKELLRLGHTEEELKNIRINHLPQ
jgi:hypothetical protein